jgi:hypothetical protein
MINYNTFYKELGNLFYAIASSDGKISTEEKDRLNKEIQFNWKHFDTSTDRFGSDRAFVIQYEFDTMEDSIGSPANAFDSFTAYFKENESEFDKHTRERIFYSARRIAESTRKINADELDYILKLKTLLGL